MKNILFLDIETIPQYEKYELMDEKWKKLWDKKCAQLRHSDNDTPEFLYNRAGIYAEFGKIICISVGYLIPKESQFQLRITSFAGDDESKILEDFFGLIRKSFNKKHHLLCAHNGKEFDYPYICRRAVVNGLNIPQILDISNKKPWEVNHLDTLQMWKFGDYKSYTSLDLLAALFDIPSPKDNIDGSQVMEVYYQEKNLKKIVDYCEKDVSTLVNVYLKIKNNAIINDSEILYIPSNSDNLHK
jgi:predicted PolB exonuclease-like 3'-5' exonuclease